MVFQATNIGDSAIVGVRIDCESINQMLMVSITGTAVTIE
ncbi:MAG: heavy metal-binding domain-containing protein [Paracoccaceae bacterium]|nr:heavy metal-binding domain-containing protein [Paracoccaceae bacterium]